MNQWIKFCHSTFEMFVKILCFRACFCNSIFISAHHSNLSPLIPNNSLPLAVHVIFGVIGVSVCVCARDGQVFVSVSQTVQKLGLQIQWQCKYTWTVCCECDVHCVSYGTTGISHHHRRRRRCRCNKIIAVTCIDARTHIAQCVLGRCFAQSPPRLMNRFSNYALGARVRHIPVRLVNDLNLDMKARSLARSPRCFRSFSYFHSDDNFKTWSILGSSGRSNQLQILCYVFWPCARAHIH